MFGWLPLNNSGPTAEVGMGVLLANFNVGSFPAPLRWLFLRRYFELACEATGSSARTGKAMNISSNASQRAEEILEPFHKTHSCLKVLSVGFTNSVRFRASKSTLGGQHTQGAPGDLTLCIKRISKLL
jgi:hypothetical protein